MDIPATTASVPDLPQQTSPFLKLPTELRLVILEMAVHTTVDDVVDKYKKGLPMSITGAFALANTCCALRNQSLGLLMHSLGAKSDKLEAEIHRINSDVDEILAEVKDSEGDEYEVDGAYAFLNVLMDKMQGLIDLRCKLGGMSAVWKV